MGNVLNACKSSIAHKSTPETINETHLEKDDKAYLHQRKFEEEFLKNTEDLIQEITTNSQWQHHETRYLLSQFRKLAQTKETTNLTTQQFLEFLPELLETFISINDKNLFESNKTYAKWLKHFIKLFAENNDSVTFQSFANMLSTACRGDNMERAQLLFDIFDVDGDNAFNQSELHLFLYFIFNIEWNHEDNDDTTPHGDTETKRFDLNKIIDRSGLIEYIQHLIAPKPNKTDENKDKTTTNGMESNVPHETNGENANNDIENDNKKDENEDKASPHSNNSSSNTKSSSTDKVDSEWEKIPLKKEKNDVDITNIDFLVDISLHELKTGDNETLSNTLSKLLKDKLYRKNKLKRDTFIEFASKCIDFDHLFESFMIIPTRDDERKIIKELMGDTEMKLGASWFVLNKEWWDKWCAYTGYNVQKTTDDTKEHKEDDELMDATMGATKRAMRPIKISNRDLLDEQSYYTVLRKGLQENNEFILLPKGAWEQLHEWYGGGPSIERFVVCTDKTIRMKEIDYILEKLQYEYVEQERLDKEAMKKKRNKQNRNHKVSDGDAMESANGDNHNKKKGAFDMDTFNKEYPLFLDELSMTVNSDTLRIDLHPICCNFVRINDKNQIADHSEKEFMISRYATLPELYINICARTGYSIRDITNEKKNYLLYLESKRARKTNERAKENKDKKNKKKDKKIDKNTVKIALPPRMWTVRNARGGPSIDRLLYPIPKIPSKEKETNDDKDKGDTETQEKDKDTDKETEKEKETETTKTDEESSEEGVEDDVDLQTIGLVSGVSIAIEFAHPHKKKGGALCYNLNSKEEDAECEPEIDDSWLEFEIGDTIDARDRWGKWYEAKIKYHKAAAEEIPKQHKLSKAQEKMDIAKLTQCEGVFIHYSAWEDKWDEWVFFRENDGSICKCRSVCDTEKDEHRIAAPNTQSVYREEQRRSGGYGRGGGGGYGRTSSRHYGGYHSSDHYGSWSGRGRESVRGTPSTAGCVGLVNLGNTCFMNSIIQCVSNTPHFRTFFTSGQYKPDINRTNPLGMKGELATEFAKLVTDVWSGDYKVIAPRSLKHKLSKFAPQFSGWQQHDSQEFLAFLLDGLHEDLNLVQTKPYTDKIESQGRTDQTVADLSWKIYLKRNKSKIVDLFQAQQKSHVICPDCNRNSITFDTYMYLSVPIVGHSSKSLIVDVFHRRATAAVNKPVRHIFHVNKYQKVRDLAQMVAKQYETKEQFVLFYENWNMKVAREHDHNLMLGMVPDREALACYILKDWNEEVTPQEIKKKKLSLQIAKLCHSVPLTGNKKSTAPLFGMPFVVSFLNIHTRREVHQVVYQRLFAWVGPDILTPPPVCAKLNKVTKEKENENENENDKEKEKEKDKDEEDEYEYVRATKEELDEYEKKWDEIFASEMPYKLRLMPYRHYSFYSSRGVPEEIPCDDVVFESKIRSKDIDIIIEWTQAAHDEIKGVVNKVVVDAGYSKYKKEKQKQQEHSANKNKPDSLTLYDCINAYVAQETLGENDLWYCSECKKHERANKKLDLFTFPEILIIHLKRFQVLGVGRFGRGEKISTFVDCPIRGLDLTPYLITDANENPPIYDLYAVSCHSGSCGGGHYTAYALNDETDRWYYFNDTSVRPAKETDIISSSSYVLFYKKCH